MLEEAITSTNIIELDKETKVQEKKLEKDDFATKFKKLFL
jgi:hypothetical protein